MLGLLAVTGAGADLARLRARPRARRRPPRSTPPPASASSPRSSTPTTSPTRSASTPPASTPPAWSARRVAGVLIAALGGGVVATGWVILVNAVSYVAPILTLRSLDARAAPHPRAVRREPGQIRAGVHYVRGRPDLMLILAIVFFTGTFGLNFQMTSALMATEVFGKGATRVRPARHVPGGRLADRVAGRRPAGAGAAAAGGRRGAGLRRASRSSPALMPTYLTFALMTPLLGLERADHDHRRQRLHAAPHRPGHARPGDGAVHDDLHRRYAARRAAHRLDRRGRRRPLDAVARRRRDGGRRARGSAVYLWTRPAPRSRARCWLARTPARARPEKVPPERCRPPGRRFDPCSGAE